MSPTECLLCRQPAYQGLGRNHDQRRYGRRPIGCDGDRAMPSDTRAKTRSQRDDASAGWVTSTSVDPQSCSRPGSQRSWASRTARSLTHAALDGDISHGARHRLDVDYALRRRVPHPGEIAAESRSRTPLMDTPQSSRWRTAASGHRPASALRDPHSGQWRTVAVGRVRMHASVSCSACQCERRVSGVAIGRSGTRSRPRTVVQLPGRTYQKRSLNSGQ